MKANQSAALRWNGAKEDEITPDEKMVILIALYELRVVPRFSARFGGGCRVGSFIGNDTKMHRQKSAQ